jgi:hypothetical protein
LATKLAADVTRSAFVNHASVSADEISSADSPFAHLLGPG